MSALLEVPVPDGELGPLQDAAADLERRAQRFHDTANEVDRLSQVVAQGWNGEAAAVFDLRVVAARRAIDGVSETHVQTATIVRGYCDQWEETDRAAIRARRDIESASSTYRRDGKAGAQHLADQIKRGIESLDDPIEGIPVLGDIAGAATSGVARLAHEFVDRLLSWNPDPPQPRMTPVSSGAFDVGDVKDVARAIGNAAEWGVGALLDGIDKVIDLVGGVVHAAVRALEAIGEAFVDAVESALRFAGEALETLFEVGRKAAVALGHLVASAARVVFDAVVSSVAATIDFLIAIGTKVWDVVEFVLDGASAIVTGVLALLAGAIRKKLGLDERRMKDPEAADRVAFRELYDPEVLQQIQDRQSLSDWSYKTSGAPEGWERVQNYPGTDGFFAVAFRRTGTDTVVLAYRGTDKKEIKDWREDAFNAAELPSNQARQAIETAKRLAGDPRFAGLDVEYTGHSLGGSLAGIASIATGRPARTFNAASIGAGNHLLARSAGGHGRSEKQIVNYYTAPDVLTALQKEMGTRPAAGAQVMIDSTTRNPVSAHALDAFDWSKFESPKAKVR